VTTADEQTMRQLPTAVLYDVFRDTATALSAQYVARSDRAATGDLTDQMVAARPAVARRRRRRRRRSRRPGRVD
jgi:hypothetical protein